MLCYGLKKYTEIFSLDQSSKFTFFSKYVTLCVLSMKTIGSDSFFECVFPHGITHTRDDFRVLSLTL